MIFLNFNRYFVVGVTYIMLGSWYSFCFHLNWTVETLMGGYRWRLLFAQMAPHLGWLFGAFNGYGFIVASLNLFELCVVAFCGTLLYGQVIIIVIVIFTLEYRNDHIVEMEAEREREREMIGINLLLLRLLLLNYHFRLAVF